ncbi:TAXI family TRAP transporter solute-binding subunit [Falsirhodobacter halotolerans]|uniref:TAXI family TRAP transporter solute-binding subunit n=1 Tax=Falsirhodobacter halotolerans TaxID=1146892 RepID=UPI001FD329E5|nr:TAXI family TRAP transporter solute-binding subunit [Falsirhodobacter halotolerans]MCJ8140059.1 TAXI family TRAP transporter solute-binding subunit [Falsirhodobacter halotolerans]
MYTKLAVASLLAGSALPATAQDAQLPARLAMTTYDVGSSGYAQAVALGKAISDGYGVSLRVLPATSDVARLLPIRQGRVDFALIGSEAYNAFEGTEAFAEPEMGPQNIALLAGANSSNCFTLALQGDTVVSTAADLRGKRVGWVVSSPALQANVAAFLAFGGLTWDDVKKVEVASFGASWDAFLNGQVDAITSLTTTTFATQAAASPVGLSWLDLPEADTAGWDRLREEKPQFSPRKATVGPGLSEDHPVECAGFPYPVIVTYADKDEDVVYNATKALQEQFDAYADAESGLRGFAGDLQDFEWVVPYHPGAVRYWKEAGLWSDEAEAHNQALIARHDILSAAWDAIPEDARSEEWPAAREKALAEAGN